MVEYMSINFSGGKSFAQYPISPSAQAILLLRDTAAPAAANPFKRVRRVVDADDIDVAALWVDWSAIFVSVSSVSQLFQRAKLWTQFPEKRIDVAQTRFIKPSWASGASRS
jgi:hypothetical protein